MPNKKTLVHTCCFLLGVTGFGGLLGGLLGGCATGPAPATEQEMASADYGDAPVLYQAAIAAYFHQTLKDPGSLQYGGVTQPVKGMFNKKAALIEGGGTTHTYGWRVDASINAKNSYGGYVGFKTYQFLFRGEQIVGVLTPE